MIYFVGFLLLSASFGKDRKNVKIYIESHKEVYRLEELGVSVEHLKRDYVETHLTDSMIEDLRDYGYIIEILSPEEYPRAGYHNYNQMVAKLDSIISEYTSITRKVSIGKSVQNRDIWALKISDNVSLDENEPEIRFIGIIHGDEPIGCELTLYLADTLTSRYGFDPYLTQLVDSREIYLIPMFNPDGREAQSRYNANGEDLNRDFPVPDGGNNGGSQPGMEVETQALINWSDTMDFIYSVTYHSGARVVNYQWDYTHSIPPFYELIRRSSVNYAIRSDSIFHSPEPNYADSGTIRGSEWYVVRGSLQDWAYDSTDCIDLTVELDPVKWPPSSKLSNLWENNKESMIWLIDHSGKGVRGIITDENSGDPVPCSYYIDGYNKIFNNNPDGGDYYRPLTSGIYTFIFDSPGYNIEVVPGVVVNYDSTTILNVDLSTEIPVVIDGTVDDDTGNPVDSVLIEVTGFSPVYSDNNGFYSINAQAGELFFKVNKFGYASIYDTILITNDTTINFTIEELNQYDYYSVNTPVNIPDNDISGIYDSIYVQDSLIISDILVYIDISHSYIGDLAVEFISPDGTEITLHNHTGGSSNDIIGWYDTEIQVDGPNSLDDFTGENSYGWWKLFVSDNAFYDTGTLNSWGIRIFTLDTIVSGIRNYNYSMDIFTEGVITDKLINIGFRIPDTGYYSLKIYDSSGRKVKSIFENVSFIEGFYNRNIGLNLPDGVYFIRLIDDEFNHSENKIILLR